MKDWVTCAWNPNYLRLTPQACAEFYRRAQGDSLEAQHALGVCRCCRMGMQNAGAIDLRRLQQSETRVTGWSS